MGRALLSGREALKRLKGYTPTEIVQDKKTGQRVVVFKNKENSVAYYDGKVLVKQISPRERFNKWARRKYGKKA